MYSKYWAIPTYRFPQKFVLVFIWTCISQQDFALSQRYNFGPQLPRAACTRDGECHPADHKFCINGKCIDCNDHMVSAFQECIDAIKQYEKSLTNYTLIIILSCLGALLILNMIILICCFFVPRCSVHSWRVRTKEMEKVMEPIRSRNASIYRNSVSQGQGQPKTEGETENKEFQVQAPKYRVDTDTGNTTVDI